MARHHPHRTPPRLTSGMAGSTPGQARPSNDGYLASRRFSRCCMVSLC
jgi:hypothetical protein